MEDTDVFDHLLEVEAQALALIDEAQADADLQVSEAEKQNQIKSDERYHKEAETLEEEYNKELSQIKEEYTRQLNEYKKRLEGMTIKGEQFFLLLDRFLQEEYLSPGGGFVIQRTAAKHSLLTAMPSAKPNDK